MRRSTLAALASAGGLLVTSCSSTSRRVDTSDGAGSRGSGQLSTDTAASGAPGESGRGTASDPGGVSSVRGTDGATSASAVRASQNGPIQIGFLNTKVSNGAAFGLNVGQTYPPRQAFEALVAALNERGGVAGRRILPVVADTDTATARWESDYQAACAHFTEDNNVSAVVGYSFALIESFESCIEKAGAVHLNGAYAVGDRKTHIDYPTLFATTHPTADRRYRLQLEGAVRAGYLTKTSRLGLILDACPSRARAYERTIAPYISSRGLNVVSKVVMDCAKGASDVGAVVTQIQNSVLKFRAADVDRVFIEGIPFIVFANAAEAQNWHPGYLLTSTTGGRALEANSVPRAQLENIRAYGWFPVLDVSERSQPAPTTPQRRCLSLLKAKGLIPKEYNDFLTAYTTCDAVFLYERALKRTRGVSTASVVRGAIESLGTTYESASVLEAKATFAPGRHEAPTVYRPWSFQRSCVCFAYTGPAQAF